MMKGILLLSFALFSLTTVSSRYPPRPDCGPVCYIYCEFGNIPDSRGCPTCACRPRPCPAIQCPYICPNGYVIDVNGCQTCACEGQFRGCYEPKDPGPCYASIPRWYYNPFIGRCLPFTYGGCQGNNNNFMTKQECLRTCSSRRY